MTSLIKNAKEKIESDGWVYLIGSKAGESGLFKVMPNGGQAKLLYKCNIEPTFFSNTLKSIWKVEDGWVYFQVNSAIYREKDNPDDPYSEYTSYVDYIGYKIKPDGTELTEASRISAVAGLFTKP